MNFPLRAGKGRTGSLGKVWELAFLLACKLASVDDRGPVESDLVDTFRASFKPASIGRDRLSKSRHNVPDSEGAGVVELEYTAALEAAALIRDCGFESHRPHPDCLGPTG